MGFLKPDRMVGKSLVLNADRPVGAVFCGPRTSEGMQRSFDETTVVRRPGGAPGAGEFSEHTRHDGTVELHPLPRFDETEAAVDAFSRGLGIDPSAVDTWSEDLPDGGRQTLMTYDAGEWRAHTFMVTDTTGATTMSDVYATWDAHRARPLSSLAIPVGGGTRDDLDGGEDPDWLERTVRDLPAKAALQRRLDEAVNFPQNEALEMAIADGTAPEDTEPTDTVNVWATAVGQTPILTFTDRQGARVREASIAFARTAEGWRAGSASLRDDTRVMGAQEAASILAHYEARIDEKAGHTFATDAIRRALNTLA